ncbi:MAG: DNA polymerase II [Deltaproteobacteria bacterium]|nr:DNA polymerase II [Deltaproteobacteria bacterium]
MEVGRPAFQENPVLFGYDRTPRLIAFELEGGECVRLFAREGERLASEVQRFTPFLLLADRDPLRRFKGDYELEELKGEGAYRHLVRFPDWPGLLRAKAYLQKVTGKGPSASDTPYLFLNDPVHQHLLLSGQTHFLDLPFEALRRLQLDIEVYCTAGFEFPNAARPGDRITAIALADSSGWERVLSGWEHDEAGLLRELTREIRERDPDVIEGHNIFRFDLEYLEARAARHGVELAWGRDGSPLRGHASRLQIAERVIAYRKYEVYGRHIVDTWLLAQHYDVSVRELESFNLKDIARHFHLDSEDRTYIPPDRVSWYFDHEPETLMRYAQDDVRECRALSELLSPSYFVQAQIFPYSYQNVVLRGNATKIDSLFLREYLRQRHAIPLPAQGEAVTGGYADIFFQGVARGVLHCDVTSLYPSIMLGQGCFPKRDELGVSPALLRDLKEFRVQAKELARSAEAPEARGYLGALQATFKILINSFYGYLGFAQGHFNDYEQANRVTATGRELITRILNWLREAGARPIEIDTDGIYFVPPPHVKGQAAEEALIAELARTLPAGIVLELDGRYPAMLSYKVKNYALLGEDGRLIVKGSSLKSRGIELFQRQWMEECFRLVLTGRRDEVRALMERYARDLEAHRLDVGQFMKTETLQDSLETYRAKTKGGRRNLAAAYELALRAERPYQPGDKVSWYVTGEGKNVKAHEHCKLASEWDPAHPDENVEHYKAKLVELYEKFRPVLENEL